MLVFFVQKICLEQKPQMIFNENWNLRAKRRFWGFARKWQPSVAVKAHI